MLLGFARSAATPGAHLCRRRCGCRRRCARSLPSLPSPRRLRAEDTVTGFLLAGVGQRDASGANFLVVDARVSAADVTAFFAALLARGDVGLIIISQPVADSIRATVAAHTATIPMVLEIPSTQSPYDPSKDALMKRVLQMLGEA